LAESFKAVRGMHDILPDTTPVWQFIEDTITAILQSYGYREIRLPLLEKTELFERSIGENTDIVSKEMYTFTDRSGENLTLRPEGTAGGVRAGLEHGLFHNTSQRLWYMGPMFRYERPQKGRTRQFHQIGAEAFGLPGPDVDAELIIMCARFWRELNLEGVQLEINTLGMPEARRQYRRVLTDYFRQNGDKLDEDSRRRLDSNPLRILDSKNTDMEALIQAAPSMTDYLDRESLYHFKRLQELLDAAGVAYRVNPRLVRGLDYYNRTVFEWLTDKLGAQGTICAGGRYDGLVEYFGGEPTPAIGFAMGLERLVGLLEASGVSYRTPLPHAYFIVAGETTLTAAIRLAEECRDGLPRLRLVMHCGGGSLKSQFKRADKYGADIALILGEDEIRRRVVAIKPLRIEGEQIEVGWPSLPNTLEKMLRL